MNMVHKKFTSHYMEVVSKISLLKKWDFFIIRNSPVNEWRTPNKSEQNLFLHENVFWTCRLHTENLTFQNLGYFEK